MKKAEFIKIVSKIEDTFEDEFRAEFNSPELIWEALIKQLTIPVVVKSLPQDNLCIVCNLPTDGVKCYSKRCPV